MKKIALVTTFRGDDPAYSLCNVANDQLKMLVAAGYKPVVLVTENFTKGRMFAHPSVELRYLPDQNRSNQIAMDENFMADVKKLEEAMMVNLRDIDVVITHDVVYQPDALKHRIALLQVHDKQLPKLRFLHWIHSATSPYSLAALRGAFPQEYQNATKDSFPNSFYVFMNEWSRSRISSDFNVNEQYIRIIPHPTDYFSFAKYEADSIRLILDKKLHEADYTIVYPIRLDVGKQVEVQIKTIASLKKLDFNVRLVVVDFHSSSDDPNDPKFQYRQRLKDTAVDWGLGENEVTFTSEYKPEWKVEVPSAVISDLFDVSNVFIMSSASESFSLITQEAGMRGNLLVLNRNFPPFREIFGQAAIHWPFNSAVSMTDFSQGTTTVNYAAPDAPEKTKKAGEERDFMNLAKTIVASTQNKQNITRRDLLRTRNLEAVFRHKFEPAIYDLYNAFPV